MTQMILLDRVYRTHHKRVRAEEELVRKQREVLEGFTKLLLHGQKVKKSMDRTLALRLAEKQHADQQYFNAKKTGDPNLKKIYRELEHVRNDLMDVQYDADELKNIVKSRSKQVWREENKLKELLSFRHEARVCFAETKELVRLNRPEEDETKSDR